MAHDISVFTYRTASQIERRRGIAGLAVLVAVVVLVVLAFTPVLAPVRDPLLSGGISPRRMYEFLLIALAVLMASAHMLATQRLPHLRAYFTNFGFLTITAFCALSFASAAWSPSPILAVTKSVELWLLALLAILIVETVDHLGDRQKVTPNALAVVLFGMLLALLAANVAIWGEPLARMAEDSARPRLTLGYTHPQYVADFVALTGISLIAATLATPIKLISFPFAVGILWLTNSRLPLAAFAISLLAMSIVKLRNPAARLFLSSGSLTLVSGYILYSGLRWRAGPITPFQPLLGNDMTSLNGRTEIWSAGLELISHQPVLGYGYYSSRYLLYGLFDWPVEHLHNSLLQVLLTTGAAGLLLLLIFLIYVWYLSLRTQNPLLLGVASYSSLHGLLDPVLFMPGFVMFMLFLSLMQATRR